ncbi:MAG: LCP family protein [Patescibacteria group bacterium]
MRRNYKNKSSAARGRSIDGIVSDGRRLGAPAGRLGAPSAAPFHPNRDQPVDSLGAGLRRAEGFHPMRSGSGSLGVAAVDAEANLVLDEPIILDELATSKKNERARPRRHFKWGLKRPTLVLLALIVAGGLFMGAKFYITERHLFRGGGGAPALASNIDISKLRGEGDGRVNILVLGIGGPGHEAPDLTDTIMIASIDPTNNQVSLLSLPRDLWVKIPGNGSQKLNAAYAYGKNNSKSKNLIDQERDGLNLLDKTLSPIIGIPIHYHAIIDFKAFAQAIDAVGGVTFNVPETLYDPTIAWENKYNPVIAQKGTQTFNGARALLYAKSRETSTDFARSERQRQLMVALKDKILSVGTFSNPIKITQLLSSFGDNIYTDFSLNDVKRLYEIISKIPSSNISSLDLVTPPHDLLSTANLNGLSIVQPKAGLYSYDALGSYIRNALRDGLLIKENAPIAIYNATSVVGLATKKAKLLKSYGYNVTTVESLSEATDPAKSMLIDLSGGVDKYTRHYLEQRLAIIASNKLPTSTGITPPSGTKFVIILGKDANGSTQ